jgi:crotonobetainyl-CoA:carnitine CoA-transferase CaiB-like acyl-CoA transferase
MGLGVDIALLTGEMMTAPPLSASSGAPLNPVVGNFQTSDGKWICLSMLQPGRYWHDFCQHLGREDLAEDERWNNVENLMTSAPAAAAVVAQEIASRPFAEWKERFKTLEGQWAPVQNALELGQDAQVRANGYIAKVIDAEGNERELVTNPVQFDETPASLRRAPQFAEQTDEILRELSLSDDEIIQLKIDGVVT